MTKLHPTVCILALAAACLSTSCDQSSRSSSPTQSSEPAIIRDIVEEIRLSGDVAPAFQVEIKPEVGGKLREVRASIGDHVKKGDLLFVIDDSDLQIERSSAEVEIEGAKVSVEKLAGNLARARELFAAKLISQEYYENLDADHRLAENSLQRAQRRLETMDDRIAKTRVLAPADGTILSVPVIAGQVVVPAASVNSGTTLATLADLSSLIVDAHINQLDISKVFPGSTIDVLSGLDDAKRTQAKINFIAPLATIKNNVKGFTIQAVLEGDTSDLRPGMTVSLRLPLSRADQAVSIPVGAVFDSPEGKVVYVKQNEGSVEKRRVDVGTANLFYVEIRSGLNEGEQVLLSEPDRDADS